MENLAKLVGKNIRELRKMKELTIEGLSEKADFQTSFLAGVERGERNITLETLEKILNGLEVDVKTLFSVQNLIADEYYSKKEIIDSIVDLLNERNLNESRLIYKITKEIFETYDYDKEIK
ncbi:helix-turn-helix domain-containing protein [Bacillus sp. FJAT-29790]|uniref:helix-turn-helix domain-containing protein n=1 Tax=Bacillus sp. FJAT-29790 TaxID=1895002 RepID=UPI001C22E945|nr:helix-turn-helix transcriptional regulator [Bacillus sp. FJAT-29790]MBU8879229.1 helix-turn-helix domain-containing protein [Bacillus sp. FJAT-29790]